MGCVLFHCFFVLVLLTLPCVFVFIPVSSPVLSSGCWYNLWWLLSPVWGLTFHYSVCLNRMCLVFSSKYLFSFWFLLCSQFWSCILRSPDLYLFPDYVLPHVIIIVINLHFHPTLSLCSFISCNMDVKLNYLNLFCNIVVALYLYLKSVKSEPWFRACVHWQAFNDRFCCCV